MIEHLFNHIVENNIRRNAWIDSMSGISDIHIDSEEFVPRTVFHRHFKMKHLIFTETKTAAQISQRTKWQIATQNIDHVVFMLHLKGNTQWKDPKTSTILPDECFVFADMSQERKITTKGVHGLSVTVPLRFLEARDRNAVAWHGRIIPSDSTPIARVLADHMKNLAACLMAATPLQKDALGAATLALCNAALLPASGCGYDHVDVAFNRIRQFIDRNLTTVDAEMLMAQFGLSRTPLYKLFEAEGGVYAYIRSRRLAHAMQLLTCLSSGPQPTVKQLTYACGFENEQVFSRAFRRKYGLNPREVGRTYRPYADWDRTSRLMAWLKDL